MNRTTLTSLCAAMLVAALGHANTHASRLEKPETLVLRGGPAQICAGCRVYVESTRGGPVRLDRAPRVTAAAGPLNVCSEPGISLWFPEEGEHLSAFLNSHAAEFK